MRSTLLCGSSDIILFSQQKLLFSSIQALLSRPVWHFAAPMWHQQNQNESPEDDMNVCGKHLPPGILPLERRTYKLELIPLAEQAESKCHKGSSRPRGRELFSLSSQISLIFQMNFSHDVLGEDYVTRVHKNLYHLSLSGTVCITPSLLTKLYSTIQNVLWLPEVSRWQQLEKIITKNKF